MSNHQWPVTKGTDQSFKIKLSSHEKLYATNVIGFFNSIHPVSDALGKRLHEMAFVRQVQKGTILVKQGEVCRYLYWIQQGLLRGYIMQGKKDITTWITGENEFVTSITSYFQGTPAKENIESIEDCILIGFEDKAVQSLYETFPETNILARKVLEKYYQDAEERAFIVRLASAGDKWKFLLETKPHFVHRIPLKYLASFLAIRVETLSRVRKKISKK
jgi:CRP-like cAMP-binding protein